MDNTKKIEFNQARNFGDKINVTFSYVSQNFKSLSLSLIYIMAPLMLIGGIVFSYFFNWYFGLIGGLSQGTEPNFSVEDIPVLVVMVLGFTIVGVLAGALIVTVTYSHMMIYKESDLHKIEVTEVWERTKKEFTGILGLQIGLVVIFIFAIAIIGGILVGIPIALESIFLGVLGYFATFVLIIYAAIAISLSYIIKINENADFFTVIQRSLYLIRGKWWSTFGLLFVMNLIAGILSYVFAIPLYVGMMADILHNLDAGDFPFDPSAGTSIASIAGWTIYLFGTYVLNSLLFVAIGFQYFNLVELKEATGLMGRIDTIGQEAESDDSDEDY